MPKNRRRASWPPLRSSTNSSIRKLNLIDRLQAIGDGAIAAYVLSKRPLDLFCACFAFGIGAMVACFAR